MDEKDGGVYLACHCQERLVHERHGACGVPAIGGVARAVVEAARRLVVVVVVAHELRRIIGQRVHHAAGARVLAGLVVGRALGGPGAALLVAGLLAVAGAKVALAGHARHVVHGHGRRRLDARVERGCVDCHTAKAADSNDANVLRIYVVSAA